MARLEARAGADRPALAARLIADRGAVRKSDVLTIAGVPAPAALDRGAIDLGGWVADPSFVESHGRALLDVVGRHHDEYPLRPGLDVNEARAFLST